MARLFYRNVMGHSTLPHQLHPWATLRLHVCHAACQSVPLSVQCWRAGEPASERQMALSHLTISAAAAVAAAVDTSLSLSLSLFLSLSLSARQIGRLSLSAAGYDDTELGIEKLEEGMEDGSSELAGWLAG